MDYTQGSTNPWESSRTRKTRRGNANARNTSHLDNGDMDQKRTLKKIDSEWEELFNNSSKVLRCINKT